MAIFNWRKQRLSHGPQFRFGLDGENGKIELIDGGKAIPVAEWLSIVPDIANAMAELRLLAEPGALGGEPAVSLSLDYVALTPSAIARIDSQCAEKLGMPPPTRLALDLKPIHRIDEDRFRIARKWVQPSGYAALVKPVGAILQTEAGPRRIPEPLWSLYNTAGQLDSPLPKAERFQALAELQRAWPSDAELQVEADGYLRDMRVHYASGLSLKMRSLTPVATEFDPVLFGANSLSGDDSVLDEDADSILSPASQKLFANDRFRREAGVRPVYVLQNGEYVFVDPNLRPALDAVRKLQDAPETERRAFVLNPRRVLRERLGHEQAEAIGLDRLFVETEQFSARVSGVDVWRTPVLSWLVPSVTNRWLPEKFGLRVGDEYYVVSPEALHDLIDRVDKAHLSGASTVDIDGIANRVKEDQAPPPHFIPVNEQTIAAIDALRPYAAPQTRDETESVPDQEAPLPSASKLFLVVKDNFEEVAYSAEAELVPGAENGPIALPGRIKSTLKAHQIDGVNWLVSAYQRGLPGVLLADDMGLGKTLQSIAFLAWLQDQADDQQTAAAPVLIVAPTGLLGNWQQEIELHLNAPRLGRVALAFGGSLKQLREQDSLSAHDIETGRAALNADSWRDAGIVLTTYETMRDYHFSFAKTRFGAVIYDEIQKLKNPASQVTRAAQALNGRFVLGMTGTPVENRLQDLWSIMDVIAPGTLGSSREFERRHPPGDRDALERLKERLSSPQGEVPPMLLRRMKKDILTDLPTKTIVPFRIEMPPLQARAYREVVVQAAAASSSGTIGKGGILSTLSKMRGISLHPLDPRTAPADLDAYAQDSARLSCLLEVIKKIADKGEKALIFVEDLAMQDKLAALIQSRFSLPNVPARISGEVQGIKRQQIVNAFQSRPGQFDVMILSPKAGGVGLTLTAANHVIHLSRWWNPAVEDQATDRVFRIGQKKEVFVYLPMAVHPDHVIGPSSFDLQLDALIERKRQLSQDLFFPPDANEGDLNDLFRHVAFGVDGPDQAAEQEPTKDESTAPAPIVLATAQVVPQPRPTLSLPKVAQDAGVKIWRRGTGEQRPTTEILGLFKGKAIQCVRVIDPYSLGSHNARGAQIQFASLLAKVANSLEQLVIEYSADVDGDGDDMHCRRQIGALFARSFKGQQTRLQLVRRHHRTDRTDDFHDRSVEIDENRQDDTTGQHILMLGRGLEALFDLRRGCTITYVPPAQK